MERKKLKEIAELYGASLSLEQALSSCLLLLIWW